MNNISFKIGENTFYIGTKVMKPYLIDGVNTGLLEVQIHDGTSILISPLTGELFSFDICSKIISKILPDYCNGSSKEAALILREQKIQK